MSQQLINHSPDLKRLHNEGFEIEVRNGYLIVDHIPYVNSIREIKLGKLIAQLSIANGRTGIPATHVIHFMGDHPCNKDGSIISGIQHASPNSLLFDGIVLNHSFSNKPQNGYANYYDQVMRYVDIISAPAISLNPGINARTFKALQQENAGVFRYHDTNASRANILPMLRRFNDQRIAIVGIGGTGSYLLDLIAKVPVKEIHLFDGDQFCQHNAFRSPGAFHPEDLDKPKAEHFGQIYSLIHSGIRIHPYFIEEENLSELDGMDVVFICVDQNEVRKLLIEHLISKGVLAIDVGIGVNTVEYSLIGTVRVTTLDLQKHDHVKTRIPLVDSEANEYAPNIQIAELNALAASFAIIKWKKLLGFYQDLEKEYHMTYSLNVSQLVSNEILSNEEAEEVEA